MNKRAAVIDYGLGNLPSVTKALERIGVQPVIVERGEEIADGLDAVVLPGVGHFGTGARNLRARAFDAALKDWAAADKPLLGICVGMQLFMETSEEDPDERGLGIFAGTCKRLQAETVPHMGWNTLDVPANAKVLSAIEPDDMAYFVHSFHVVPPPGAVYATTTYGETFCSALEHGNVVGVQFHPEKSADVGRKLLTSFFENVVVT